MTPKSGPYMALVSREPFCRGIYEVQKIIPMEICNYAPPQTMQPSFRNYPFLLPILKRILLFLFIYIFFFNWLDGESRLLYLGSVSLV